MGSCCGFVGVPADEQKKRSPATSKQAPSLHADVCEGRLGSKTCPTGSSGYRRVKFLYGAATEDDLNSLEELVHTGRTTVVRSEYRSAPHRISLELISPEEAFA